jgi:hypothetical protein
MKFGDEIPNPTTKRIHSGSDVLFVSNEECLRPEPHPCVESGAL